LCDLEDLEETMQLLDVARAMDLPIPEIASWEIQKLHIAICGSTSKSEC